MKNISKHILSLVALILMSSCYEGIDPLTEVDPGPDAGAPTVNVIFPTEGSAIQDIAIESAIDIQFEVSDDIEIQTISVKVDGSQIATFNSFLDYRNFSTTVPHSGITSGEHTVEVSATDISGNTTNTLVNFSKEPPYSPVFNGEFFYMPFDGTFTELVTITDPTQTGNPSFAGESFLGTNSYKATTDSYLTFPLDQTNLGNQFTGAFWYKVNASPDRSGILTIGDDEVDRNQGFRLFREGSTTEQRIKINIGTGTSDSWNDGGVIDVTAGEWIHIAFTISPTESVIYFNGVSVNTIALPNPIDWTGCNDINIGAGGPTFSYWNHLSDNSAMDELRLFNVAMTQTEIQNMINVTNPYTPIYNGETFYMPFDGSNTDLISLQNASEVGNPQSTTESYAGSNAFTATTDSYLTFPINNLFGDNQFSTTFWYKVNATPDRSGILTVGDDADDRNQGFRLFREGNATEQRIKVNIGTGTAESWNDGGVIDVTAGEWVHIALTVSPTESKIYINGAETLTSALGASIDWTGCTQMVIGAGGPTFDYWGHLSDSSIMDELRMYNTTLTQTEIQSML